MAITIDVISPARVAPAGISYSRKETEQASLPFIPVRWLAARRSDGFKMAQLMGVSGRDKCPLGDDFSFMSPATCEMSELSLMEQTLIDCTAKVGAAAQQTFAKSALGHAGAFKLAYIPILAPEDADITKCDGPKPEKGDLPTCHAVGCSEPADKRCSGCQGAYYCSGRCQKADWKARHKVECTGNEKAVPGGSAGAQDSRRSVSFRMGQTGGLALPVMMTMNWKSGSTRVNTLGETAANYHKADFLVKVQVPLTGAAPLLIDDQGKTFQEMLPETGEQGKELTQLVRTKGINGMKAHLNARREGDTLRIFTDKVLPLQPW